MKLRWISLLVIVALLALALVSCAEPREVRSAEINEKGELVLTYTDGTQSVLGVVRGQDGVDGVDGVDGKDGLNGKDGKDGKDGKNGSDGINGMNGTNGKNGANGRGIRSIEMNETGDLVVTYDDQTTQTVSMTGSMVLFAGMCTETAAWVLYNGGILVLGGTGAIEYAAGEAPWTALIPMLSAVVVNQSEGLTLGEFVLSGIDEGIIQYFPQQSTSVWVDMTVSAPLYETADTEGAVVTEVPLGTELILLENGTTFTKVRYGEREAYIETRYVATSNGSVTYEAVSCTVKVTNAAGANLRTYPDATEASSGNIYQKVAQGAELNCVGVSLNGRWLKISYEGQSLYCLASLVEMPTPTPES